MDYTSYILSLFGYAFGLTFIVYIFFSISFIQKTHIVIHKRYYLLGLPIASMFSFFTVSQIITILQNNPPNIILIIQTTSSWIILLVSIFLIFTFLIRHQPLIAILFYGSSICFVLIVGRILFLNLNDMIKFLPLQLIHIYTNLHIHFLFFIISHFFISIALLHVLTKTRFLLFLPDNLLPVSAIFITSLEATYALTLLL